MLGCIEGHQIRRILDEELRPAEASLHTSLPCLHTRQWLRGSSLAVLAAVSYSRNPSFLLPSIRFFFTFSVSLFSCSLQLEQRFSLLLYPNPSVKVAAVLYTIFRIQPFPHCISIAVRTLFSGKTGGLEENIKIWFWMPARKCGSLRKGHSVRTAPGTRSETRKKLSQVMCSLGGSPSSTLRSFGRKVVCSLCEANSRQT